MSGKKIGLIIFTVYLVVNLLILKDYGLSWDYHYHYFAGLYHLGLTVPSVSDPSKIPFSPPDPRLTVEDPFGPFTQIIPTLSSVIFTDNLNILPYDISYNLPLIIFGSLGILILYLFLLEAFNLPVAILGSLFLALNPIYFGYLHNNMKDIPNSAAFALSLWLFWRLIKYKNLKSLLFASFVFALAFNIKINSVFIPVIAAIYYLITNYNNLFNRQNKYILLYFILAPVFALMIWWPFWNDPLAKLLELPKFYSLNTFNMPVLFFGKIYRSGINIPAIYPYAYLAVTAPLLILVFSMVGLKSRNLLLLLWFFIPLLRYLNPKTGAIDGVRHFMEVLYPLSAFAGIGFWFLLQKFKSKYSIIISIFIFSFLIFNLIKFHPYQTSYFSSATGGIKGAWGKFDIDFWGTPQKEAAIWLNKNAPRDAFVHIVMAQSTAATYLRSDLLENVNKKNISDSDYIILLNRQSFFDLYGISPENLSLDYQIVYSRNIESVPLFWIFKKQK